MQQKKRAGFAACSIKYPNGCAFLFLKEEGVNWVFYFFLKDLNLQMKHLVRQPKGFVSPTFINIFLSKTKPVAMPNSKVVKSTNSRVKLCVCPVTQSCLTLCNPMDCSLPGFSFSGIFQATILEWVAISYSRESSQPESNPGLLHLLHWQADSLPLCHLGRPT